MNFFGVLLVLASVIAIGSAGYRPTFNYNLTLNTGNHSFAFQGLTKITLNVNGQNYSYTNLT